MFEKFDEYELMLIEAIRNHPEIQAAALTGSRALVGGGDEYSDVDLFLLARDLDVVRRVREWLPRPEKILLCDFHLQRYCSLLLEDFSRIDLAIHHISESPSSWVVRHHELIKGSIDYDAQLVAAEDETARARAVHLNQTSRSTTC
jgi:Streptomycin adenylyltransferase